MGILNDPYTWLIISFTIFVTIVWRMGKNAMLSILDSRIDGIRNDIETAENLRTEAQELLAQYQRKHRDAMKESEAIIASSEKQVIEIRRQAEAALQENMERREEQLSERIVRMQRNAISEIQQYAADLAIKATTEIITHQLDKKAGDALIDQAIKDVGNNLH